MTKMRDTVLMIGAGLLFGLAGATGADTLDCKITNYNDFPYSRATLEMLLPQVQRHVFSGQDVRSNGVVGIVTQNDSSRLKWKYSTIVRRMGGMTATVSYTLIRHTEMLIIRVQPGGITQRANSFDAKDFRFAIRLEELDDENIIPVHRITGNCVRNG